MNSYTVIRSSNDQELKSILALRYLVLRQPWDQPAATATDELESSSINAFIRDENGQAIACGRLQENENNTGQIRFMAVHPDHQGKGLGKKIVVFLEEEAKKWDYKKWNYRPVKMPLIFTKAAIIVLLKKVFSFGGSFSITEWKKYSELKIEVILFCQFNILLGILQRLLRLNHERRF